MKECTNTFDSDLLVTIGGKIDSCFPLIEKELLNNTTNQFTCSVSDLSQKDFKKKLGNHFAACLRNCGLYVFSITTSTDFKVTCFKKKWDNSIRPESGKRPKSNAIHTGQRNNSGQPASNEYVLYVGSSLKIGSRIKEHFWDCDTSTSTYSLRLRCSPNKCLQYVDEIKVNYVSFEGLSDEKNRETALHNLCRYFEKKMNQKYQALIGE